MNVHKKRTKIVCTIGPACNSVEKLTALVKAGMNVCRLNFSHGTHEDHAELMTKIRALRQTTGEPLAILQDLQGPKIRVGELPKEGVILKNGEEIVFTSGEAKLPKIGVTYPNLHAEVNLRQRLLLDDGLLEVVVTRVDGNDVICEVVVGGTLTSHKGLNLPDTRLTISAMSEKDREDVRFGVEHEVDWMALSFVRSAQDLRELRKCIAEDERALGKSSDVPIRLIAKIEKPDAVVNIDEIIAEADGIMVARGDLGIEMAAAKVPVIQKMIIAKCLIAAKPVIVATQMLDSMIRNPRATRAEISDIANAVIDHCDATMLSGETASGAYPVEAVQVMSDTIEETEASLFDDMPAIVRPLADEEQAMTNVASVLAQSSQTKAILVASMSGQSARYVSRERPPMPIFVGTPEERIVHQLNLSWAVSPFVIPAAKTVAELIAQMSQTLLEAKVLQKGDEVVMVAGEPVGESGHVNLVELRKI